MGNVESGIVGGYTPTMTPSVDASLDMNLHFALDTLAPFIPTSAGDGNFQEMNPFQGAHVFNDNYTKESLASNDSSDSNQSRARKRRFPCTYKNCMKAFISNKDLERHLSSGGHRKDAEANGESLDRFDKYMCRVPWCKRANVGFSREDHYARHLRTMHPDFRSEEAALDG
ncbi:hypothetical protein K491DRAFT_688672 [Lophiostoma macrostomum CBS 122681]|uniref:C2H2-type domain-containing protein n=1 Tax=Lophiostoma macrostomum CBS 122681 TaxID=1314788 RepID=A0A6A6TJ59_9PLEO|nr:hypothetical protein K491DRAFT_688672 [Lophiostoma macrostomum CBS 122681]